VRRVPKAELSVMNFRQAGVYGKSVRTKHRSLTPSCRCALQHKVCLPLPIPCHHFRKLTGLYMCAVVTAVAIAAVSLTIGYRLGARQDVPASPPPVSTPPPSSKKTNAEIPSEVESDGGDDELADGDLSSITAGFMEACKLASLSCLPPACVKEPGANRSGPRFS
jgi:hypothetical protein